MRDKIGIGIMNDFVKNIIDEKRALLDEMESNGYFDEVIRAGEMMKEALLLGNKILLAGNGGSAADAQHFAGEILGRFTLDRNPLPAISLCTDPTTVTSISNDYGFEEVFARQLMGLGTEGDIFVAISTSGNSGNVVKAVLAAKEKGLKVVGMLGGNGGRLKELCDISLIVPHNVVARVQEMHTLSVHILCEMIEKGIFANE